MTIDNDIMERDRATKIFQDLREENLEALVRVAKYGLALERIASYPSAGSWECRPLAAIANEALGRILPHSGEPQNRTRELETGLRELHNAVHPEECTCWVADLLEGSPPSGGTEHG